MAARFVIAAALVAVCYSSPVLINGEETREGRSYSIGQGYSSGFGGSHQASANANGDTASASGNSNNGPAYFRDAYGNLYPSESLAKAESFKGYEVPAYGAAQAQAQANNGAYYPVPVPVAPAVISYNQNFEAPAEIAYEVPVRPQGPVSATSVANSNGISDSSLSSVSSNGGGIAESNAQTQGGAGRFGLTNTNAKTFGGAGSAASNANAAHGIVSSNAKSQGFGAASSSSQSNGALAVPVIPVVAEEVIPAVVDVKQLGYRTVYTPAQYGSASSNANVHGHGSAASSAKTQAVPTRRSIHWHFGTAYDIPAGYAKSAANTHGYGSADANAVSNAALGAARTTANTHGYGNAQSAATQGLGYGAANSAANSQGGYANADANVNNGGLAYIRSEPVVAIGYGNAKTAANTHGNGNADAVANLSPAGYGVINSAANTQGGSANSHANINNPAFARNGAQWGHAASTNAQSNGYGSANSSVKNHLNAAYRVVNSNANTAGWGSANSNAQTY